ncbi:sulfotransferase 4A1-like isoform X3 [Lampetra fluviatilis]
MDQPTFQWQYFQHGSVRLPPFCRGRLEAIASFPVRPDDVWIASYPKSGTSVLQEMVFLISQGVDPAEVGIMNIAEQMPVLEHPQPGLDILMQLTTPRIIKTHLPYGLLPRDLWDSKAKVVYMARNPKDLAVSYYQFLRSLRTPGFRGSFPEFCRRFLENRLAYGSWFDHVQEFWNHRNDEQILFLKYEDLHQNLPKVSEQLQAFLSIKQETAHAQDVVQHCSQLVDASMQPHARDKIKMRSSQYHRRHKANVILWKTWYSWKCRFSSIDSRQSMEKRAKHNGHLKIENVFTCILLHVQSNCSKLILCWWKHVNIEKSHCLRTHKCSQPFLFEVLSMGNYIVLDVFTTLQLTSN